MTEKVLGEGCTFEDVEKIRKQLTVAEHHEFMREETITNLKDELARKKAETEYEIDKKVLTLRQDKKARKDAGFSRDDDWVKHIRNELLADYIEEVRSSYADIEAKIESKQHNKKLNHLRIKNLSRKLRNRQIFANAILNGFEFNEEIEIEAK